MPRASGRRRWPRRAALALVALLAADPLAQHTLLADGELAGLLVAPYDPPLLSALQRRRLAELREQGVPADTLFDAELGWAPRPGSGASGGASGAAVAPGEYDERGARRPRATPPRDADARLVVALGCSFTHGDEVAAAEAWPAQVDAARPDLAVANLAFGAYGLDQALLRLRRDGLPLSPAEVWLGWVPSTTPRATTSFPPLQNPWTSVVLFKPRFTLGTDGALTLVPNPARAPADTLRLLEDPARWSPALADDPRVRRAPAAFAPRGASWLHHSALGRLWLTWRARRAPRDPGRIASADDELRALAKALVLAADRESRAAGAGFRLVVLPSRRDLESIDAEAPPYWSSLTDELAAAGIVVHDLTDALLAAGARDDDGAWRPEGHYAPATNALVAERLAAWTRSP